MALPGGRPRRDPAAAALRRRPVLPRRTAEPGSSSRSPGRCPSRRAATFPFQLLTGRGSAAQWHTQTRTAKSDVLRKLYPRDPYVEINPADARGPRADDRPLGGRRVAAGVGPRAGVRHADRARGTALPAHARQLDQPADALGVRPGVAAAGLQGLRGAGSRGPRTAKSRPPTGSLDDATTARTRTRR